MIVALTGGTGFIGRHVLASLLHEGYIVRALNRAREATLPKDPQVTWIRGDISDVHSWYELLDGASAVIHLAAPGVHNVDDTFQAFEVSLQNYHHIFKSAAHYKIQRIVVAGSCFEYGSVGDSVIERGLVETDPTEPTNAYAGAKAAATLVAKSLTRNLDQQCFVLRPFHTYGAGESERRLIPTVIRSALRAETVLTTDGRQVRDFIHVSDVAQAFVSAIKANWPLDQPGACVLNLSTGRPTQIRDLIEQIVSRCGQDPSLVKFGAIPYRKNEMWRLVGDPTAAARVLNWRPAMSLTAGIDSQINSIRRAIALLV